MRSAITPGATLSDDALPDHTSVMRSLSELQGFRASVGAPWTLDAGDLAPVHGWSSRA